LLKCVTFFHPKV